MSPIQPPTTRGQAGFTLLEVLVALLIAGLALGVLFQGTITGLAATARAGRYEEAVERARSHLAALADTGRLGPVDDQGDDGGGYRWQHRVAVITTAASALGKLRANQPAGAPITLYAVSVAVTWTEDGRARGVALATQRLGMSPAEKP
jgi:general secretion pathway protein I